MLQYKRYIENIWDNFVLIKGGDFYDNEKEKKAISTMS